jgi:hypothetical protein
MQTTVRILATSPEPTVWLSENFLAEDKVFHWSEQKNTVPGSKLSRHNNLH